MGTNRNPKPHTGKPASPKAQADQGNFDIGGSSLLAFALDLRPSKDTRRKLLNRKTTGCYGFTKVLVRPRYLKDRGT